jgi:hypothetical protein
MVDPSTPPTDDPSILSDLSADRDQTAAAITASQQNAPDYASQLKDLRASSDKDEDAMQGIADKRMQNLEQPFQGQAPQRPPNILSNLAPLLLVTAMGGKATKLNAGNMFAASSGIAQGYLQGNEELYQENVKKYQDAYKQFMEHQEAQDKMLKVYEDAYKDRVDYRQKAIEATLKTMDDQYSRTRNLVEDKERLDHAVAQIKENHAQLVKSNYFEEQNLKLKQQAQKEKDDADKAAKQTGCACQGDWRVPNAAAESGQSIKASVRRYLKH